MPILCSIEPQRTALRSPMLPSRATLNFGVTNSEMPLAPAGASGSLAMRLGQAHRPGPGAGHQRLQEHFLLPVLAVGLQRLDRAVRKHREVAPGEVCAVHHFGEHATERGRHALAAEFRIVGQAGPAAFDELVERLLEARRHADVAGRRVELAADLVADAVERRQHGFGEARGFVDDGVDQLAVGVGEAEPGEVGLAAEHVEQGEADVVEGGLVAAHGVFRVAGPGRPPARGSPSILRRMVGGNGVPAPISAAPPAAPAPGSARWSA